jgi:hypothetical protein
MRSSFAHRTSTAVLSVFLFSVSSGASAAIPRRAQQAATKITAMKVSTVEPSPEGEMGTLSDIFEGKTGNAPVFAGTGAANYPTRRLMVMVEATGEDSNPSIELTGREGRRLVYRKISKAFVPTSGSYGAPATTYSFFFIEGDRCETIKLTARIVGQRRPSTMTKTIEFGCGE